MGVLYKNLLHHFAPCSKARDNKWRPIRAALLHECAVSVCGRAVRRRQALAPPPLLILYEVSCNILVFPQIAK